MSGLATLRIHRPRLLNGAPTIEMAIMMDGRKVAELDIGQEWSGHVEPGRHSLWIRQWYMRSQPLEVVLSPYEELHLEIRSSRWAGALSLVRVDGIVTHSPACPPPEPLAVQVLGFTETHQSVELIGTEKLHVKNASDVGRVTQNFRVTKEWSRMTAADLRETTGLSGGPQIGPNWLQLKANLERGLEHSYGISTSQREEFSGELSVEAEPGMDITVILTWKRIWQHGQADVLIQGRHASVPYRLVVGLTFDQSSR